MTRTNMTAKILTMPIKRDSRTPLYQQVRDNLAGILQDNHIPPGVKIPSLRKMAKAFSLSSLTVLKAVAALADEGILQTVEGSGTFTAKAKSRTGKVVAVLLGGTPSAYMYAGFLRGIGDVFEQSGLNMMSYSSPSLARQKKFVKHLVSEHKVMGIIAEGGAFHDYPEFAREIAGSLPLVVLNACGKLQADAIVYSDDNHGCSLLLKALARKGHKRIAFFASRAGISTGEYRRKSFEQQAKRLGICCTTITEVNDAESGYLNAMRLIVEKNRISAIACWTDGVAAGVLRLLHKQGISVPREMAVVGYGNLDFADKLFPQLTTVDQSFDEMGRKAAECLVFTITARKRKRDTVILTPTKLVLRESL